MKKEYVFLAGRILYALPLIIMGSNHFMQMPAMVGYAESKGLPVPQGAVIISGLVLILGAVSVLVGYRGKIGAWLVTAFLLATAFLIHRFWSVTGDAAVIEMTNFYKNIIMAGAALMVTYTGTGPYSVDNLNKPRA